MASHKNTCDNSYFVMLSYHLPTTKTHYTRHYSRRTNY